MNDKGISYIISLFTLDQIRPSVGEPEGNSALVLPEGVGGRVRGAEAESLAEGHRRPPGGHHRRSQHAGQGQEEETQAGNEGGPDGEEGGQRECLW